MRILGPLVLLLCAVACSEPRAADVRAEYLRAHPGSQIVSAEPGEGDFSAVYYHVRYRAPGDSAVREEIWQYIKQSDGTWRNTHREPRVDRKAGPR
jgi:hypothetical protein